MSVSDINTKMVTVDQAKTAIEAGRVLWLAGDQNLLSQLPKGRWIGGTIPYFMSAGGGVTTKDSIYVAELDVTHARKIQIKQYNMETIKNVAKDAPENGFTILIMPAFTDIHASYAENAPSYEDMFLKPIAGWVSGLHLDDLDSVKPGVFNGGTAECLTDKAIAMHVTLAPAKVAHIGIVNIQEQADGDSIEFTETGFSVSKCLVNGVETNFADYMVEKNIDSKSSLVADYSGAMINVAIWEVSQENNKVSFYGPVFNGVEYKFAKPVEDYVSQFSNATPQLKNGATFSCNCVLNYLYQELEGKQGVSICGPMTFGEIAYQLLNQTLVYVYIDDI